MSHINSSFEGYSIFSVKDRQTMPLKQFAQEDLQLPPVL
jgi:hypothetical protein